MRTYRPKHNLHAHAWDNPLRLPIGPRHIGCLKFIQHFKTTQHQEVTIETFDLQFSPTGHVERYDLRHYQLIIERVLPSGLKVVQLTDKARVILKHSNN